MECVGVLTQWGEGGRAGTLSSNMGQGTRHLSIYLHIQS